MGGGDFRSFLVGLAKVLEGLKLSKMTDCPTRVGKCRNSQARGPRRSKTEQSIQWPFAAPWQAHNIEIGTLSIDIP